jgi:hypothetical protein
MMRDRNTEPITPIAAAVDSRGEQLIVGGSLGGEV